MVKVVLNFDEKKLKSNGHSNKLIEQWQRVLLKSLNWAHIFTYLKKRIHGDFKT